MTKIMAAMRRRALVALRIAVENKTPTTDQALLIDTVVSDLNRNVHRWGKGAGQSTVRMMIALRVLEDDR